MIYLDVIGKILIPNIEIRNKFKYSNNKNKIIFATADTAIAWIIWILFIRYCFGFCASNLTYFIRQSH
jgi:hypothetical protein